LWKTFVLNHLENLAERAGFSAAIEIDAGQLRHRPFDRHQALAKIVDWGGAE
jgi:hypothetical protein